MIRLVELLLICLPLTALAPMVGGHAVEPAWVLAAALAACVLFDRVVRPRSRPPSGCDWTVAIFAFLLVGTFALLWSPYATGQAWSKGLIQVVGVLCALGAALAIARCVQWRPALFERFARLLVVVMVGVAAIGLVQFVLLNVFRLPALGEFTFFEKLTGNPGAWRYPGRIGGIVRVNSIAAEPAHLAQYLGCISGFAWLRLGFLGRAGANSVRRLISRREAWVVMICAALTVSVVGYATFALSLVALFLLRTRFDLRRVFPVALLGVVLLAAGLAWVQSTQREFGAKLATIPMLLASSGEVGDDYEPEAVSAMAILGNRVVTASNLQRRPLVGIGLGAHPESFAAVAPQWEGLGDKLNAQDASGLLLRLLSETGALGLLLFGGVWFVAVRRARRALLDRPLLDRDGASSELSEARGIAWGITAGCAAVFVAYLARMGVYYAPTIWILLGFVSIVPARLRARATEEETHRDTVPAPASSSVTPVA